MHDTVVTLIEPEHPGRRIELSHLAEAGGTVSGTEVWEAGPLLDAHLDRAGQLWVLEQTTAAGDVAPFTVVRRVSSTGRVSEAVAVSQTTRLILGASNGRCLLLAGTGEVIEVAVP